MMQCIADNEQLWRRASRMYCCAFMLSTLLVTFASCMDIRGNHGTRVSSDVRRNEKSRESASSLAQGGVGEGRSAEVGPMGGEAAVSGTEFIGPDALRWPDSHYRPDKTEVNDEYTALPLSRLGIKEIADLRKDVLSSLPSEPDYRSYQDAKDRVKDGYSLAFYRVEERKRKEDTPPQFHLWLHLGSVSEQGDCLLDVLFRHWYAPSNPHCREAVYLGDINLNSSAEELEKVLGKPAKALDKKLESAGRIRVREWYVAFGESPKRIAVFLKSDWSDAGSLKSGKYGQGIAAGDDELLLVNQSAYIWYESGWFE